MSAGFDIRFPQSRKTRGWPLRDRIDFYSMPVPECGCRVWLGTINSSGYGNLRIDGQMRLVHRAVWVIENGPIPDGLDVLHWCDTPLCIEGGHLFLGTNDDNVADRVMKGRSASQRGERNPRAKLTEDEVSQIRASGDYHTAIADRFGVSPATIDKIKNGSTWR